MIDAHLIGRPLDSKIYMSKRCQNRIQKSKSELMSDLNDQLQLLLDACLRYDEGFELAGKQIATTLRILLNEHGQSRSLLEQLGMRSGHRFFDTAGDINKNNILAEVNLLAWGMRQQQQNMTQFILVPQCLSGIVPPTRWISFPDWWVCDIVRDSNKNYFSRMNLVSAVANTDGGAHVDPGITESYHQFKVGTSGLMTAVSPDGSEKFAEGRPELACMRQIAHEVVLTLQKVGKFACLLGYEPKSRWAAGVA